jgi:hypothetical protein
MGDMSKLGWLIGFVKYRTWTDILYLLLFPISRILSSSQLAL